jgi:hypothetical protein
MRRHEEREWIEYMAERNRRAAYIRNLRRKKPSYLIRLALLPEAPVVIATAIAAITILILIITENL